MLGLYIVLVLFQCLSFVGRRRNDICVNNQFVFDFVNKESEIDTVCISVYKDVFLQCQK